MKYKFQNTIYACYRGAITQAIIVNLMPLFFIFFQDNYQISFEMLGRLILINFGTQFVVDILAVRFIDKLGYRRATILAHFFAALGLILLGTLPRVLPSPYIGLVLSVVCYAIGGGLIEVIISPIVDSLPSDKKASDMSLLHSFYSWGQVGVVFLTTILLKLMGNQIWFLLPYLWAILPIYNLYMFTKVPLIEPKPDAEKISLRTMFQSKLFLVMLLFMLSAGAAEIAMSQWASLFAEKGLKIPKIMGDLLGPCFFGVLMGIGRSFYGIWGEKISLKKALVVSSILCLISYLVTALVQIPILSLISCAFCGLAVSLMWPGVLSVSARCFPSGGAAMFGVLAIFGDLGCSLGPWMVGLVSDLAQKSSTIVTWGIFTGLNPAQLGLKFGILTGSIFPIVMLIGLLILHIPKKGE